MENEIKTYVPHDGTIKVSGTTIPERAGKCAFHFLNKGKRTIDFFCIGANANQQASKAMGVFAFMVRGIRKSDNVAVAFEPLRFSTLANDDSGPKLKDAMVWRTVIYELGPVNKSLP